MKKHILLLFAMALLISFSYGQSPTVPGRPQPAKPLPTQPTTKSKTQTKTAQKPKPVAKPKPIANPNKPNKTHATKPTPAGRPQPAKPAQTTPPKPAPTPKPTPKPAPKPTLDASPQTLSFTANGGSQTVTVKASTGKWYKTDPQEKWVSLATKANTVTVKVSANTNTQKRSTSFKVVSGNLSKTVSIKQEGAMPKRVKRKNNPSDNNETTSRKETKLTLSSYSELFKAEGESKTITVSARESWSNGLLSKTSYADWYIGTQPDASWVSYTKDDTRLTIKVSPNTKTTKRTDYFTVKCGDVEKRFDITQAAATPAPVALDRSYGQWVDLGLPSGTLWKNQNETNPNDNHDFYTYDEAVKKYGDQLPTEAQLRELKDKCKWTWKSSKKGYIVVGPNGNSIFLPAAGLRYCDGLVDGVGSGGGYWSSTPGGSDFAGDLYFYSGEVSMVSSLRCGGRSVRLVQD